MFHLWTLKPINQHANIFLFFINQRASICYFFLIIDETKTMIFMVFSWFHHENLLVGNFHYYIPNHRVKIRHNREFGGNRKVHLFVTAPLMGFGTFFKISFFSKNNGFRAKKRGTLKIYLFIRDNFC